MKGDARIAITSRSPGDNGFSLSELVVPVLDVHPVHDSVRTSFRTCGSWSLGGGNRLRVGRRHGRARKVSRRCRVSESIRVDKVSRNDHQDTNDRSCGERSDLQTNTRSFTSFFALRHVEVENSQESENDDSRNDLIPIVREEVTDSTHCILSTKNGHA